MRMPTAVVVLFILLTVCLAPAVIAGEADILITDFEGEDFGEWTQKDDAFGPGPAKRGDEQAEGVSGYLGDGFAGSNFYGHRRDGILTSPEFKIERPYINLLVGGGLTNETFAALEIHGEMVRSAMPDDSEELKWVTWDVKVFQGQRARIKIVDTKQGMTNGYVYADHIYQSSKARTATYLANMMEREVVSAYQFNADPRRLPLLGVVQRQQETIVTIQFPDLPGTTCDAWCYEVPGMTLIGAAANPGGSLTMTHRVEQHGKRFRLLTDVIPEPGAVEFVARAVADEAGESLPEALPRPNLCFQMERASSFKSPRSGEYGDYIEFVRRCFIVTKQGQRYLMDTKRRPIPARPLTDEENNPPWVQMYLREGVEEPATSPSSWAAYSPDRYQYPLLGTVSHDGKHLIAIGENSADMLAQAWHDCLHSGAKWLPSNAPPKEQSWRLKVYLMENDVDSLVRRLKADFALREG